MQRTHNMIAQHPNYEACCRMMRAFSAHVMSAAATHVQEDARRHDEGLLGERCDFEASKDKEASALAHSSDVRTSEVEI